MDKVFSLREPYARFTPQEAGEGRIITPVDPAADPACSCGENFHSSERLSASTLTGAMI